jgi:hypothetical protein
MTAPPDAPADASADAPADARAPADRRLRLPPPYDGRRLDGGDPHAAALAAAAAEGAGAFPWRIGGGVVAAAVTLEPATPLREARLAFFAGMAALGDALAAHAPPERAVRIGWPDTVIFDRARLGGGRFAAPPGAAEDAVPDWLVFSFELIGERDHLPDPGAFPGSTSLAEEEFDAPEAILESFASYLMLHFDRWAHEGPRAVTQRYLDRLDPPRPKGFRRLVDGDLVERDGKAEGPRRSLAAGLAACAWRDARGPRL